MTRWNRSNAVWSGLVGIGLALGLVAPAYAKDNPAQGALAEQRGKTAPVNVIQNKFFTKSKRFEFGPVGGYVPNNSFVDVYVGGLDVAYHFSESLAAEGMFLIGPNTGNAGVKNLTKTLLDIAYQGDQNTTFQQPLDRFGYGIVFSARWSPVYGKINLVGEGVINFDVYGTTGPGIVGVLKDVATVSQDYRTGASDDPVALNASPPTDVYFAWNFGIGFDFFVSQMVAIKLDVRDLLYVGPEADYGNIDPKTGQKVELQDELHQALVTSGGVTFFIPKMKRRVFNF